MKKKIISAICAGLIAVLGMTAMTTSAYDPWYYNTDTGELSNFSEVIYNNHLDWIKSYDNYYNAEHDVYCERVDYLAEEINSYLPSVSLGAEKVWKISFPTGVTNIYTEERVPDCLRLRLNAHYLTDERKEDGVTIPQEVYDSLFYEFKDYILSEFDDRFAVEYDRYQGYGSPRFDYIYGVGEQCWISLTFDSSDKAENYETACEITQKLVDKYGSEAVSSDLWLDCHGMRCYYFSDNEFESDGFSAIDAQQIERASYSASAAFTKIDVTRGFAYFDVAGLAESLDLQPISENNLILSENVQIAEDSPVSVSLLGDVNLDGRVSISDSVAIIQYLANSEKYPLSPQAMANADIYNTGDGITGGDASYIQQLESTKS